MCPDCKGNGWQSDFTGDSSAACSTCKGSGIIPLKDFCNHLESSHRAEAARAIKLEAEVDRLTKEKSELVSVLTDFTAWCEYPDVSKVLGMSQATIFHTAKDLLTRIK